MEKEFDSQEVFEDMEELQEWQYVNFGWINSLAIALLVLGGLSLSTGVIFIFKAFSEYFDGPESMIAGTFLMSGLTLMFMSGILKVALKIERNTRL